MIFQMISLCSMLVMTVFSQSYQSNKYPAGVHPNLCPHYPYCDNTVLAGFAKGVAAFRQSDTVPGYPASLSPHACPNYPYCSHQIPPEAIHYRRLSNFQYTPFASNPGVSLKYSSRASPASCPNFAYCH